VKWSDPKIGKWLAADPTGFGGEDTNLYRYVGNSPLASSDFAGLATVTQTDVARRAVRKDPTDGGNVAWSFWRFKWMNLAQDYAYMVQRVQSRAEFSANRE
jgi:hypothetical protein